MGNQLQLWEEVTGTLTKVQQRENRTVITVDDAVITVTDLSPARLNRALNTEVSIVRAESGHRLIINGDEQ